MSDYNLKWISFDILFNSYLNIFKSILNWNEIKYWVFSFRLIFYFSKIDLVLNK